jgi:hypothetical protein
MKYLMLVCWDGEKMNAQSEPDPTDAQDKESFPWLDDVQARGIWVTGDQLAPPRRARSVRVRDGKTLVTDGPFGHQDSVRLSKERPSRTSTATAASSTSATS